MILTAQQGEQQRASQMLGGIARRALHGGKAAKKLGKHPGTVAKAAGAVTAARAAGKHPARTGKLAKALK